MHARYTIHQQPARPHEAAPASMRRPPRRHAASNVHSQHRDQRAYYMSKYARTQARCTCTATAHTPGSTAVCPATSCSPAARSTAASRRVAPPLAVAAALLLPPREAPRLPPLPPSCLALHYHGRCRRQGTCESRTGDSDSRPTPLPVSARSGGCRPRASSGAAREAGWRRADIGGWWRWRMDAVQGGLGRLSKL